MAVSLVNSKAFTANIYYTDMNPHYTANFDVRLLPIPDCHKSLQFCSGLQSFLYSSEEDSYGDGLSEADGISVTFIVNTRHVGNKNPFKVELSGLFFTNVLKGYTEPMRIKLEFLLENQKFNIVSKELSLPIASTDEIYYRFEDKLFLSWETNSSFHSYSPFILTLNGTMTIQLLSRDTPVLSFPDATWTNKKILHDKIRCDFALRAENGKAIPCHTSMLACHSKVFERMFETDCKEVQEKTCQMHITEGAVNALLKFLYYSDLDDATKSSSISLELLKIAHEYDIGSLEIAMKNTLLDKKNVWFDWDVVLLLFQFAFKVEGYQDLKEKAVAVMKSKSGMLRGSSVFDDIFKNDLVTAKELFLHVLNK